MKQRILVATDGRAGSLGALRTAKMLAERDRMVVDALAVVEPTFVYGGWPAYVNFEEIVVQGLRDAARRQLREVGGQAERWDLDVRVGSVARVITGVAEERGATLVVLGSGMHSGPDRWLGGETALNVVRLSRVPVLVVPGEGGALPGSALAAVDFGDLSLDAARAAAGLLPSNGVLHLAHVSWSVPPELPRGEGAWMETYDEGARTKLEALRRELESPGRVWVKVHLLHGEAAPELLALAEREGVGLLAAGSHGSGFFSRAILGSVSTRLFRGAPCAVLATTPRGAPPLLSREEVEEELHLTAAPGVGSGALWPGRVWSHCEDD